MTSLSLLNGSQADDYKSARPEKYPSEWYEMLADKTIHHQRAWDVGTGSGQAAIGLTEYYERVVATDINLEQLKRAKRSPQITYYHTPAEMSVDELVARVGGDNSVDLVTAAQSVHYFDFNKFYAVVNRVLRKPGGVIAVWVFNQIVISPKIDTIFEDLAEKTKPFRNDRTNMALEGYRTLPFPFKSVGIGSEGNPIQLDLKKKLSREGFISYLKSWQLIAKAKEQGVDLLPESLIREFNRAWGPEPDKTVVYKFYMIAGKPQRKRRDRPQINYFPPQFPYPPPPFMDSYGPPPPGMFGHGPPPPGMFGHGPPPPGMFGHGPPPPGMFPPMPPHPPEEEIFPCTIS